MSEPTQIVLEQFTPASWTAQLEGGPCDGLEVIDASIKGVLAQVAKALTKATSAPRYSEADQKVVDLLSAGAELLERQGQGNADEMLQTNLDFLGIKPIDEDSP